MEKLTLKEKENLSQLLLSTQNNNVVLGFEILKNYTNTCLWEKELVLIWQLHKEYSLKKAAEGILKKYNSQEQLNQKGKGFEILRTITQLITYTDTIQNLLEEHESIRKDYQGLMELNSHFCLHYYKVAEKLHVDYNKHLNLAEVYYRIVLKTNPNHKDNLFDFARLLSTFPKGYNESIKLYLKAAEINPKNAMAMNNIGVIYTHTKEFQKAYEYFKKALAIDPSLILGMSNLSKLCMFDMDGQQYKEEGKPLLKRLTEMEPQNGIHWDNWAIYFWLFEHNYDKAREIYKKGLVEDPKNPSLLSNLGELYIDVYGEYDKGLKLYRKALEIETTAYLLMTTITALVHHADDYTEAIGYYKKLVAIVAPNSITKDSSFTEKQWQAFLSAEKDLLSKE